MMAECTVVRCSQERRLFRKELQKWSKEILYIIGLERLAEELIGSRKWKILAQNFTEFDNENPDDWCPEDTCYLCDAKKLPPYDPASGIIPIGGYNPLVIDTDEHSTSSDHAVSRSYISCSSIPSPCNSNALSQNVLSSQYLRDQPLDLSISALQKCDMNSLVCGTLLNTSTLLAKDFEMCINQVLKVPQISLKTGHKKRVFGNSKRSYTEKELQAALRDIQSGKLGTRRAAVIYGIPRSTLRNKVYKLANESRSRAHITPGTINKNSENKDENKELDDVSEMQNDTTPKYTNNSSASESLRQLLRQTITQKSIGFHRLNEAVSHADANNESQCASDTEMIIQKFKTIECNKALAPVLSCMFANIQQLALGKCETFFSSRSSALKNNLTLPILPELIRYLAEERIAIEKERIKDCDHISNEITSCFQNVDSSNSYSSVILKVPSFKPAKTSIIETNDTDNSLMFASGPSGTSSSHGTKTKSVPIEELISRSTSQESSHFLDKPSLKFPSLSSIEKAEDCSMEVEHNFFPQNKEMTMSLNSPHRSQSSKSGKQTRAKRGRYRNYNRDNLACAVRAVQKGEMSVHRAGTVYGVPHSTLEYKVKERHLLRPKKREMFNSSPVTDTSIESACDSGQMNNNSNSSRSVPQSKQPSSVDALSSHISLWQSMPCFSLEFPQLNSSNFFASQMMQKLHENISYQESQKLKNRANSENT